MQYKVGTVFCWT